MRRRTATVAWLALVSLLAGCVARVPDPASPAPVPPAPAAPLSAGPAPAGQAPAAPDGVPARLRPAAGADQRVPAQCLAQIEGFAELHTGARVILGQAAFAQTDELVLARMHRRGADGRLLDGRAAPPTPVVLKLLSGPQGCVVRLDGTPSAVAALPACTCAALPG